MDVRQKSGFHRAKLLCVLLSLATALFARDQTAASSRAAVVFDAMPHTKRVSQVSISPNGALVAYFANEKLYITPVTGGPQQAITVNGDLRLRDVAWSLDSSRIAFIADLPGDVPAAQVWTAAADGSAHTKRAEPKGYVQAPRFSPDGAKLAILFVEGIPRVAGPRQPMTPLAGEIGQKFFEQQIATIDLSAGQLTQLTAPDIYVYEYDWLTDGQGWIAIAARGPGDANWYVASLYRVNAQTGQMREIYKPTLQIAGARVSFDGKTVAFIGGLMSDQVSSAVTFTSFL